jgi:hypothetical protein
MLASWAQDLAAGVADITTEPLATMQAAEFKVAHKNQFPHLVAIAFGAHSCTGRNCTNLSARAASVAHGRTWRAEHAEQIPEFGVDFAWFGYGLRYFGAQEFTIAQTQAPDPGFNGRF